MDGMQSPSEQISSVRHALRRFESREAIYRERDILARVRVTDIQVGQKGMSAVVTVLPTPGLERQECSSWNVGTVWSHFGFTAHTWQASYYGSWMLDFRPESLRLIPQKLLALPPYFGPELRQLFVPLLLDGREQLFDDLLSGLQEDPSCHLQDPDQRHETIARALQFEGAEGIYCSHGLVAHVRVSSVWSDERGVWGIATVIPTKNIGFGLTGTESWKVGGCWPCLHITKSMWHTACSQPVVMHLDPGRVKRILEVANGELATADDSSRQTWLADFVWHANEKELEQRLSVVRHRQASNAARQKIRLPWWTRLSRLLWKPRVKIMRLGDPFEVD